MWYGILFGFGFPGDRSGEIRWCRGIDGFGRFSSTLVRVTVDTLEFGSWVSMASKLSSGVIITWRFIGRDSATV